MLDAAGYEHFSTLHSDSKGQTLEMMKFQLVRDFLVLSTINNDIFLFFCLLCSLLIFSARWGSSCTTATNRAQLILSKSFCLE